MEYTWRAFKTLLLCPSSVTYPRRNLDKKLLRPASYRVNIFGFSNAPGPDANVGIRDVRLAVEWIRDNIAAFGGDTSRITLFGQSQGANLISYYAYAFPNDSIATSFIQQSGSAFLSIAPNQTVKAAIWKNASIAAGCDQTSDISVLECMRAQSVSTILAGWSAVQSSSALELPFGPVIDDQLVFANYTERTLAGEFAQMVCAFTEICQACF